MKNLLVRTLSGIVFLAVMIACLLGGTIPYACLMLFLLIGMMLEFYRLTLGDKKCLQKIIGITAGAAWWSAFLFANLEGWGDNLTLSLFVFVFVCWIALFIQQLYQKDEQPFTVIAKILLGFMYISLPLSLLTMLAFNFDYGYSGKLLLGLFIILWCSDVGAYCFGMLLGRNGKHKLFPSISPKKSWEGYFGGLLMALAAGYILSVTGFIPFNTAHILVIALLIHVFGVFGDLVESMLKRSIGVKDSGNIMPGHGGLLDRFDAALIAFPVACLYILGMEYFNLL